MKKKKQNKDNRCFCSEMMELNELKNTKLQMVAYKLREIIKIIDIDNIEDEYPDIKF